jgi:hypothetical protein
LILVQSQANVGQGTFSSSEIPEFGVHQNTIMIKEYVLFHSLDPLRAPRLISKFISLYCGLLSICRRRLSMMIGMDVRIRCLLAGAAARLTAWAAGLPRLGRRAAEN